MCQIREINNQQDVLRATFINVYIFLYARWVYSTDYPPIIKLRKTIRKYRVILKLLGVERKIIFMIPSYFTF